MGASHDLRSRQIVSLGAPTPRGFGFGQGAEPTETSAGNADCRKLMRATGLQLVKCESNAPLAVKMLHRKQSLV